MLEFLEGCWCCHSWGDCCQVLVWMCYDFIRRCYSVVISVFIDVLMNECCKFCRCVEEVLVVL